MTEETPKDDRPRPKYGELAPEGWNWTPPEIPVEAATEPESAAPAKPLAPTSTGSVAAPYNSGPQRSLSPQPAAPATASRGNRTWTITLIVVGFLGMIYMISTTVLLTSSFHMLHERFKLDTYSPSATAGMIVVVGVIAQIVIWVASTWLSVSLMRSQKVSFYVPLVAGVVSLAALFIIVIIMMANDPALMNYFTDGSN